MVLFVFRELDLKEEPEIEEIEQEIENFSSPVIETDEEIEDLCENASLSAAEIDTDSDIEDLCEDIGRDDGLIETDSDIEDPFENLKNK